MPTYKTRLCAIVAMAENRVIGADGEIPWHCPADLAYFKEVTQGCPVIMGRKTYESIPEKFRPLPGRRNIVLTRNEEILKGEPFIVDNDGVCWVSSWEEGIFDGVLAANEGDPVEPKVFVIGGEEIYRMYLPQVSRVYLTVMEGSYEGDAKFPVLPDNFVQVWAGDYHPGDDKNPPHVYEIWERSED